MLLKWPSRRRLLQVTAPSVEPSSENLAAHSVPTIVYRLPPHSAQPVSRPTAVAARTVEVQPAGASKTNVVLLAGAAVLGLLFAAVAFHVTRHVHLRSRTRAIADQQGVIGPVTVRSSFATKPSPMMADLPEGRKTSLRELGHHLKPTLEAWTPFVAARFVSYAVSYGRCERRNIAPACGSLVNPA